MAKHKTNYGEMKTSKLREIAKAYEIVNGNSNTAPVRLLLEIEKRERNLIPKFNPNFVPSGVRYY